MSTKPEKTQKGLTFFPVPEFTDADIAFGADETQYFNRRDMPDVPRKFKDMAMDLFYKRGELPDMSPEVDKHKAMRAVRAWLTSWNPSHESKMGTVGYALWLWSDDKALN